MKVKIDDLVFERANYDTDGDVLYLTRGESNTATDAVLTPDMSRGLRADWPISCGEDWRSGCA